MRQRVGTLLVVIAILAMAWPPPTYAQSEVFTGVRVSIKSGSATELATFFRDRAIINLDGQKNTYSQAQAEFVLRDFFERNPPEENGFQYVHQGSSRDGHKYAIGKYISTNGNTFQVVLLVKNIEGKYVVDTLTFLKE